MVKKKKLKEFLQREDTHEKETIQIFSSFIYMDNQQNSLCAIIFKMVDDKATPLNCTYRILSFSFPCITQNRRLFRR